MPFICAPFTPRSEVCTPIEKPLFPGETIMTTTRAIRFAQTGGPDVLDWQAIG